MTKTFLITVSIVLILHGLVHLIGTIVCLKLGALDEFGYKTTLLNGRWDIGETGTAAFGALWAVAAVGFVIAAVAMLARWGWWRPALAGATLFSLALTILDWSTAFAGAIINIVILAVLWLGPRIVGSFFGQDWRTICNWVKSSHGTGSIQNEGEIDNVHTQFKQETNKIYQGMALGRSRIYHHRRFVFAARRTGDGTYSQVSI